MTALDDYRRFFAEEIQAASSRSRPTKGSPSAPVRISPIAHVEVGCATATAVEERWHAILVNAGVTHPLEAWLDALLPACWLHGNGFWLEWGDRGEARP